MRHLAFFLIALCGTAAPVFAQRQLEQQTGSRVGQPRAARIPDRVGISEIDRGHIVMAEFARCTLDRNQARVAAVLAMPVEGKLAAAYNQIVSNNCLSSGEIKFNTRLLRGALFAEIWRRQRDDDAGVWADGGKPKPIDFEAIPATISDGIRQHYGLLMLADCIIKAGASDAGELVAAPIGGEQQALAYEKVKPLLGPCVDDGSSVTLSKQILEGALAEVLIRTVAAPSQAPKAQ